MLLIRSATKVRKELIDACPSLKVIGRGGVGMDNIDVDYATQKGILVLLYLIVFFEVPSVRTFFYSETEFEGRSI